MYVYGNAQNDIPRNPVAPIDSFSTFLCECSSHYSSHPHRSPIREKNIKMLHSFPRIYKLVYLLSQNKNMLRWIQDTPLKISVTLKSNFHRR